MRLSCSAAGRINLGQAVVGNIVNAKKTTTTSSIPRTATGQFVKRKAAQKAAEALNPKVTKKSRGRDRSVSDVSSAESLAANQNKSTTEQTRALGSPAKERDTSIPAPVHGAHDVDPYRAPSIPAATSPTPKSSVHKLFMGPRYPLSFHVLPDNDPLLSIIITVSMRRAS